MSIWSVGKKNFATIPFLRIGRGIFSVWQIYQLFRRICAPPNGVYIECSFQSWNVFNIQSRFFWVFSHRIFWKLENKKIRVDCCILLIYSTEPVNQGRLVGGLTKRSICIDVARMGRCNWEFFPPLYHPPKYERVASTKDFNVRFFSNNLSSSR